MVVRRQVDEKASTEKPCRDSYRLRDWVRRWNKPERFPEMADALAGKHLPSREMTRLTLVIAMAAAVDVISTLRTQVYALPCLHVRKGNSGPNPQSSKHAQDVWEAGEKQRMHFRELSRYYKLEPRKAKWKREPLLKKGKHGLGPSMHQQHLAHSYFSQCWMIWRIWMFRQSMRIGQKAMASYTKRAFRYSFSYLVT